MNDPQNDEPSALLRMAMRLYNSGYNAGHHDTVETGYVDILSCDMENYHEDEVREIVQDFLGDDLTDQDIRDFQKIFDDTPIQEYMEKEEDCKSWNRFCDTCDEYKAVIDCAEDAGRYILGRVRDTVYVSDMPYSFKQIENCTEEMMDLLEHWKNEHLYKSKISVNSWMPIDTAPLNGEARIMIASIHDGEIQDIDFDAVLEEEQESWEIPQRYYIWKSAYGRVEDPTHWAYLPIIPENKQ